MGVYLTNYVIYGVKLDFKGVEKFLGNDWQKMEYYIEGHEGSAIAIADGMSGEYIVVGGVVARSENYDGGFDPNVIELDLSSENKKKWEKQLSDFYEKTGIAKKKPKFLVVSHYH